MAFASVGIGAAFATIESTFLHRYIDFVRAYRLVETLYLPKNHDFDSNFFVRRNGLPVEVTEQMEVMVDKASDLAKLEPRQTVNLKTFIVSGFDVKSVGM